MMTCASSRSNCATENWSNGPDYPASWIFPCWLGNLSNAWICASCGMPISERACSNPRRCRAIAKSVNGYHPAPTLLDGTEKCSRSSEYGEAPSFISTNSRKLLMKMPYFPGRLRVRFGVTRVLILVMSAFGTNHGKCRLWARSDRFTISHLRSDW